MSQQLFHQLLTDIAKEFSTSAYVYHTEKSKEEYEKLISGFPAFENSLNVYSSNNNGLSLRVPLLYIEREKT